MQGRLKLFTGNSTSVAEDSHLGDKQALLSEARHVKAFENYFFPFFFCYNGLSIKKQKKKETVCVAYFDETDIEIECCTHGWFKLLDCKEFFI